MIKDTKITFQLYDGRITGKSRINLPILIKTMDTNVKHALVKIVLSSIGLNMDISEGVLEISDEDKYRAYIEWTQEKEAFQRDRLLKSKRETT